MSDEKESGRLDVESVLVIKAWNDEAFRKQLLADPKSMIEKEIGQTLPADLKVVIHEESDDTIHLVLPVKPSGEELSQDELDKVAGGAAADQSSPSCRRGCRRGCRRLCRRACRRGCRRVDDPEIV